MGLEDPYNARFRADHYLKFQLTQSEHIYITKITKSQVIFYQQYPLTQGLVNLKFIKFKLYLS